MDFNNKTDLEDELDKSIVKLKQEVTLLNQKMIDIRNQNEKLAEENNMLHEIRNVLTTDIDQLKEENQELRYQKQLQQIVRRLLLQHEKADLTKIIQTYITYIDWYIDQFENRE